MLGYLSADIICSEKRTVFRERSSSKIVSFEEQIMSKDKYPSIFSPQMETIVFTILQIFFATRAVLKIGEYLAIIEWGWVGYEEFCRSRRVSSTCRSWYNGSYTMMVQPMKTLELHYPMIQFLIISDIPQFWLGNIRSRDALRPIVCERKDLMDYNDEYTPCFDFIMI